MITREIHEGLFGVFYILGYNISSDQDIEKLNKRLSRKFKSNINFCNLSHDEDGLCQISTTNQGYSIILILLREFKSGGYWSGLLGHECFHATEYALGARGIKYSEKTKEVYAYNIGMLIKNFFDKKKSKKIQHDITEYGKR